MMITPQAEIKLQEVSQKYIPLLDKAIQEGRKQLALNRARRFFRSLKSHELVLIQTPWEKGTQFYAKPHS